MPGSPSHSTSGPAVPPTPRQWAALQERLTGSLLRPGAPGYRAGVQLYDWRYDDRHPAGILYCASPDDVARGLGFARAHGLALTARCGGHSYAGYSSNDGLVLDVSRLNRVRVAGSSAVVGAGTRLIDLYSTLGQAGQLVPGGSCPSVGIAGLTLGGGQGVVGRAYGLSCDRLRSVSLVTADGVQRRVGPADSSGLFWACQGGGGGNFGIVTSFTFATVPTPEVTLFTLRFPWPAADQVLPAWQGWAHEQPDELWSNCLLLAQPGSVQPLLQVGGAWLGPSSALSSLLLALQRASATPPTADERGTGPYLEQMYAEAGCLGLTQEQCQLPTENPAGRLLRLPVRARSDFLDRALPPAGVAAVLAAVEQAQGNGWNAGAAYDAYGGALNRVAPSATAFVHRTMTSCAQYSVSFAPGTSDHVQRAGQRWLNALWSSQRGYVTGQAYQNYIDPLLVDWPQAYYGANLARLSAVKAAYDPDRVFTFAQSVPYPA